MLNKSMSLFWSMSLSWSLSLSLSWLALLSLLWSMVKNRSTSASREPQLELVVSRATTVFTSSLSLISVPFAPLPGESEKHQRWLPGCLYAPTLAWHFKQPVIAPFCTSRQDKTCLKTPQNHG